MRLRRWIFWAFFTISVFVFLSALLVYVLLRSLDLAPPSVRSGSTLTLSIAGDLPEDTLYDLGSSFFRIERLTLRDVLTAIKRAEEDSRIENLLVRVRTSYLGWAKAEELRSALVDFKSSGKPLVAYVEYGGNLEYFLASAADEVYLHPQSVLDLRGIQAEVTFMRSTLEKLGIEAEFEQIGPYKNAPDVYTRTTLSEAHRESLESIVDDLYGRFVGALAEARNKSIEEMEGILDRGPFPAQTALELGLANELLYQDEIEKKLVSEGKTFHEVPTVGYQRETEEGLSLVGRPKLALIYGVGTILGGESISDPLAGRIMGSDTIAKAFREAREDDSIRAVVFRVNSPGGADVAADVIWREAALTMEKKPVVVSMSDVAASGGYWVATASNGIVAEPTTLTGSIGVYAGKFNLSGLYEKIGFNKEKIGRGGSADFWSDTRSFTEEERKRFRGIVEAGYRRFLERVAEARDKETDEVDAIGQGRVWTGAQAVELGLVDELGGLDRAVALAKEKAGIPEGRDVVLDIYPRKKSYIDVLLRRMVYGAPGIFSGRILEPRRLLEASPALRMLTESERLAIVPFEIHLH
jgi:protease-4